jgi:hypothetical protein
MVAYAQTCTSSVVDDRTLSDDDVGDELSLLDFLAFPSDPCFSSDLFFFPSLAAELPLLPPPLLVFA